MSKRRKPTGSQRAKATRPAAPGRGRSPADHDATESRPERARRLLSRGHLITLALTVVVLAAGAFLMVGRPRRPLDVSTEPFPTPIAAAAPAAAGFIGSDRCASCHAGQYGAWQRSVHARAGGVPGAVRLMAPFDGTPMRFADAEVVPRSSGGRFTFTVRQPGADDVTIPVDGVVGGGHMEGGGTQGFLTRHGDGTLRFLPFDYSRHGDTWFCNTIGRGNRGWVPITPAASITDCVDWPPVRAMGDEPRFSNCQSCHGSQVRVRLDTAARTYRTDLQSLSIDCESCHGPGAPHLERLRDPAAVARGDIGMRALATATKDQSLGTCWQCHALKDRLRPGYAAGTDLASYYSIRLPQLGDAAHLPDGRVRTFGYQEGHLYSDCYRNGGMTCTSCHDPHSQSYHDVTGAPIPGRFDDRQCTSCHASKTGDAASHTRHAPSSPGSRCTACHMPYLQQPELGDAIPYRRSDHTIPIPRPLADSARGVLDACTGCHASIPVLALNDTVRAWYGELKPVPAPVTALDRTRNENLPRGAAARLLLNAEEPHTQSLFDGMAWFLERHLSLDMIEAERDVLDRLQRLAGHPDDDVRALALASLHFARGTEPRTRRFLIDALAGLGERDERVRARWGVILGYLADRARSAGQSTAAVELYRRAREVDPHNARIPLNHGLALADAGDPTGAESAYRASLAMDPAQPLALVNLGIALAARNDVAGAMSAYRRALSMNPREPLAWFNIGALHAQAGRLDSAAASFVRSAELDPSLAIARFHASRLFLELGRPREALAQIEAGLRMDPSAADARQMRDQLRLQLGRSPRP